MIRLSHLTLGWLQSRGRTASPGNHSPAATARRFACRPPTRHRWLWSKGWHTCTLLPSDPSATSQLASFFTPTSFNSTDIGTPAHSLQLMMPCVYWTVTGVDPGLGSRTWRRGELLPRHSRKRILDTEGKRFEILQAEHQRTIHHAVDGEAVPGGIDIRQLGVSLHEVERRRRDDAYRFPNRSVVSRMRNALRDPSSRRRRQRRGLAVSMRVFGLRSRAG